MHFFLSLIFVSQYRDGLLRCLDLGSLPSWQRPREPWQCELTVAFHTQHFLSHSGLFASRAVGIIESHDPSTPLFLYYAMHDTHAPLEAPWEFVVPYAAAFPDDEKRYTFYGMLAFVDAATKNLTVSTQCGHTTRMPL